MDSARYYALTIAGLPEHVVQGQAYATPYAGTIPATHAGTKDKFGGERACTKCLTINGR